jgi:hypothetical protein
MEGITVGTLSVLLIVAFFCGAVASRMGAALVLMMSYRLSRLGRPNLSKEEYADYAATTKDLFTLLGGPNTLTVTACPALPLNCLPGAITAAILGSFALPLFVVAVLSIVFLILQIHLFFK